jgi:hypothetical protein
MRSRIEIELVDGQLVSGWADERYRGGPENPLSDNDLQKKFSDCAEGLIAPQTYPVLFELVAKLDQLTDLNEILKVLESIKPSLDA